MRLAGGGALALPLLLDACGGASSSGPGAAAVGSGLKLPADVPFEGPKPDLPGNDQGVPPGYVTFPKDHLVQSVKTPPGTGGDVTALTFSLFAPPPPVDQNPAWQAINKGLNANVKITIVPVGDYQTRVAATLAGGDLPDIFTPFALGSTMQDEQRFLDSSCADLTPFLSGDNIKQFPNLANFPPYAWPNAVFGGKIYMVPQSGGGITGPALIAKQRLFDEIGVTSFKSSDDFMKAMKALTKPPSQYGIGLNAMPWFTQVFGAPNNWRNDGGKLTKDIETDEYKAALAFCRAMWDAGVVHPDSPSLNRSTGSQAFYKGEFATVPNDYIALAFIWGRTISQDPNFKPRVFTPFAADGKSKPIAYLGTGASALTVIKKGSADRVRELLGVLNYIAAPFGTTEATLISYGVEGPDFTYDDKGNPRSTKQGTADVSVPWGGLAMRPPVLYNADYPEFASVVHQEESDFIALGIKDPTAGLYSPTYAEKNATLAQLLLDGSNNIVFGRNPVSDWDGIVKQWRAGGGDQLRADYQQALQASSK
jgi:putative aldouronate transport system substrate-binding protein